MAAQTCYGKEVPRGTNSANFALLEFVVGTLMAAADTINAYLPDNMDKDMLPHSMVVFSKSGATYTVDADLAITSHNTTTGISVLTASGAVAVGSIVRILYVGRQP